MTYEFFWEEWNDINDISGIDLLIPMKTLMNTSPVLPVFPGKEARQWLLRMRR